MKFLEVVKREREEAKINKLIDIGSFNLHVVHDAFRFAWEKKLIGA